TGDPAAGTGMISYFCIESRSQFQNHPGHACGFELEKCAIEQSTFFFEHTLHDLDLGIAQSLQSGSAHFRIGIHGTGNYSFYTTGQDAVGAGRCPPVVATRLQVDVQGATTRALAGLIQGLDFRMRLPGSLMMSLTDYGTGYIQHHRADHR